MRKRFTVLLLLVLVFAMITACSGGATPEAGTGDTETVTPNDQGGEGSSTEKEPETEEDLLPASTLDPNMSGEFTYWTFIDDKVESKNLQEAFNKVYPNIKMKTVYVPFGDLHDKLQTTLAAGKGAPDVALVEQGQFPRYSTTNVLVDLLEQPYDAGKYKDLVSEYNWNRWSSIDSTKLLGMPWDVTPAVTYYRADIFEELGLPSDPEELGEYIQDPENFFTLAQILKANGKYAMEWRDSPVHWYGDSLGYFDKDLNYVRNTDDFIQYLDISKRVNQLKIAPHDGILSDKGKQRVKKGESPMYVTGTYGARDLKLNFPEQKGKWRTTNMPFGLNLGQGGSTFVLPAQSQNKDAAWAFIEWATTTEEAWKVWVNQSIQPDWKNITGKDWYVSHTNEYLGGQEDQKFYTSLSDKIPVRRYTPLDGLAWPIWLDGVLKAIDKNIDSKTAIQQTAENVEKKLKADKEKLLKQMNP